MVKLPDTRSLSSETLKLLRKIAVRAVDELGMTNKQVARLLGVSEPTVGRWCAAYREQGRSAFNTQSQGRPQGAGRSLQPDQEEEIRKLLCDTTPEDHEIPLAAWTRQAVAELIRQRCGVELTLQGVGKYLRRWNMTPQRPARQAREQDPDEVQEFLEETLPDAVERAEDEEGQLHFTDEVGAKVQDQIGRSYAPCGQTPVLTIPKIRIQQNAISSVTPEGEAHFWLFSGTMNAEKFLHFLELLIDSCPNKIFLFADRHASHTAQAVEDWLSDHTSEIEIIWLPRYSPELNPDEYLNNDLKQNLKHRPMPTDTAGFRATIHSILNRLGQLPDRVKGYFRQAGLDLANA